MIATRQAYAITSTPASESSSAQRSLPRTISVSSSLVTCCSRTLLEWNVKLSGSSSARRRRSSGISVSIVVFELGTISPMRYGMRRPFGVVPAA